MDISKEQVERWLKLAETGANAKPDSYWNTSQSLKATLVEAKVLTDRWEVVATAFVFHPSMKETIRTSLVEYASQKRQAPANMAAALLRILDELPHDLLDEATFTSLKVAAADPNDRLNKVLSEQETTPLSEDSIWGADILYTDHLPINKGLALALDFKGAGAFQDPDNSDRCVAAFLVANNET